MSTQFQFMHFVDNRTKNDRTLLESSWLGSKWSLRLSTSLWHTEHSAFSARSFWRLIACKKMPHSASLSLLFWSVCEIYLDLKSFCLGKRLQNAFYRNSKLSQLTLSKTSLPTFVLNIRNPVVLLELTGHKRHKTQFGCLSIMFSASHYVVIISPRFHMWLIKL